MNQGLTNRTEALIKRAVEAAILEARIDELGRVEGWQDNLNDHLLNGFIETRREHLRTRLAALDRERT